MRAGVSVRTVSGPRDVLRGPWASVRFVLILSFLFGGLSVAQKVTANDESLALPPAEAQTPAQLEETDEGAVPAATGELPKAPPGDSGHGGAGAPPANSHEAGLPSPSPAPGTVARPDLETEALVAGTPPTETPSSTAAGLIWFGAVFLVLVCVVYLFL